MTQTNIADGFGTARRLQALYRWGWPFEVQAERCDLPVAVLVGLTDAAPIPARLAAIVERLYDELAMKVPPASPVTGRTRADGMRRGWRLPLEWDDDEIDDPIAIPATVLINTVEANKAWLMNYGPLARQGLSRAQIARTFGISPGAIKDRLIRARAGGYLPPELEIPRRANRGEPVDQQCRDANSAAGIAWKRVHRKAAAERAA